MKKYTQKDAEKKFLKRGFVLLDKYKNNCHSQKVKHLKCGHITYTSLSSAKCGICKPSNPLKQEIAKERFKKECEKNKVIFLHYNSASDRKWKCPKCGSVFTTHPNGNCNRCRVLKEIDKSFNKLKKLCERNKDTLLTTRDNFTSISQAVKIKYRCGHIGNPKGNNYIHNGSSCNICARKRIGESRRIPIAIIKRNCKLGNVTITSNFKSNENNKRYYDGICNKCKSYVRIHSSTNKIPRCPKCNPITISEPKVETKLRKWLCHKTGEKWKKVRPKWLLSPSSNHFLELDMYCKKLKKAIEYQGPHHYIENVGIYGLGRKNILKIIKHDKFKKKVCASKGIDLLTINGIKYHNFKLAKKIVLDWMAH